MGNHKSKESKQDLNENGSRKLPTHHLPFQRKKKKIFATFKRIKNLFCKNTKKKKIVQIHNNKTSIHATLGLYSGIKTGNFTSYCSPYLLIQENISDDPLHDYWPPLHHSRSSIINKNDEDDQIIKINAEEDGNLTPRKSSLIDGTKNVAIQEIYSTAQGAQAKEIKLNQKTLPKLCHRSRSNSSNGTGDLLTCSSGSNDEFEDACSSLTDDIAMKNDISTAPTLEIICEEQLSQTSTLDVKICSEISKTIADLSDVKEIIFHQNANEENLSNIQKTEKVEKQIKNHDIQKIVRIEEIDLDEDLLKISKINQLSEANKIINDKLINLLEMNKEVLNNIADCNKKLVFNKAKLNISDEAKLKNIEVILESNKQFVEQFPVSIEENVTPHQIDERAISEHEEDFDTNRKSSSLSDKLKIKPLLKENEIVSKSTTISEAPIATEESIIILNGPQIYDQRSKPEMAVVEPESIIALTEKSSKTDVSKNIFNDPEIYYQKSQLEIVDEPESTTVQNEKSSKNDVFENIIFNEPDQLYHEESIMLEIIDEPASTIAPKEKLISKTDFSTNIILNEPKQFYHQESKPEILDEPELIVLNAKSIKTDSSQNLLIIAIDKQGSYEENSFDIISAVDDIEPDSLDFSKIKNELELQQSNNSLGDDLESTDKLLTENMTDVIVETSFNFSPENAASSDGSQSSVMEIDDDVWEEETPENSDEAHEQTAIDIKSKLVLDLLIQAEVDMEDFDAFIKLPYPLEKKYHLLQIEKMFEVHEINNNNLTELSQCLRMITKFGLDLLKPLDERPRHWKKILLPLETPSCHLLPVQDAQEILLEFGYQRFESGIIFLNEEVDAEAIAAWVVELLLAAYELCSFSRKDHPQQQLFQQNFIKDEQSTLDFNGFENANNSPPINLQVPDFPIITDAEEVPVNNVYKKPFNSQDSDLNSEALPSFSVEPSQKCHLCVSFASSIQCKQCLNLNFCSSCDDAYHRHPKRRNHARQLMQRSNSPSSPPLSNFGNLQPIAPPRQRKSPTPNQAEYERTETLTSGYPYLNHQQLIPQELHGTNQFQQSPINCDEFMHQEVMLSSSTDEQSKQPEDYNSFYLENIDSNSSNTHKSSMEIDNWSLQTLPLLPQFGGKASTTTTLDPYYYQRPDPRARHLRGMSGSFDNVEHSLMTDSLYFNNFQNKCLQSVNVSDSPHYYTMCAPKPQGHSMLQEIDMANATLSCGCQFGIDEFGWWRPMTLCYTHCSQTVYLPIFANQSPKYLSHQNATPLVPSLELTAPTINLVNDDVPTQSVKKRTKNKSQKSRKTQSNAKEVEEKDKKLVGISKEQEVKDTKRVKQKHFKSYEMLQAEADKTEPENSILKGPASNNLSPKECNSCIFNENSNCAVCGKANTLYQNTETVKNDDEVELTNVQVQLCNNNLENKQQDQSENLNSSIINLKSIKLEPIANIKIGKLELEKELQLTNVKIKNDDLENQEQISNQNKNVASKTIDGELIKIKLSSNDPLKRKRKNEQNIRTNPKFENVSLIINRKWECEHCTYANDEVNAICAVCCKTKISNSSLMEPSELNVVQPIVSQIINSETEIKPKVIFKEKYNVDQRELKFEDKLKNEKLIIKENSENNECATKSIGNINHEVVNNSVSKSGKWECEFCTVINDLNNTICSVCCKSKLTSLEKDNCDSHPTLQKITSVKQYENTSKKKENVTPNENCPKISVEKELNEEINASTEVKDDNRDWECAHCSFINDINHSICGVCCKSKIPRLEEDNCVPTLPKLQKIVPERECENTLKEKQIVDSNEMFTKLSVEELNGETQMRSASLNPIAKEEKRNWECKHCSFINNYDSKICNVCCKTKTKKDKSKLDQSQLPQTIVSQSVNSLEVQQGVRHTKSSDLFEVDEKMMYISQKADQPIEFKQECSIVDAVEKTNWECEHCTFINNNNSRICAVCCKTKKVDEVLAEDVEEPTTSQIINPQVEDKLISPQIQQNAEHLFLLPDNFEAKEKINHIFENSKSAEEPINAVNSEDKSLLLSEPEKWECDHCTFINDKSDKICNVCCKTKSLLTKLELAKDDTSESSSV